MVQGAAADAVCGWIDRGNASDYTDRFWTLDPIDGTKGFLRSQQYAIALALIVAGQPTVAVLGCPNLSLGAERGAVLTAVRGEGAWIQPMTGNAKPVAIRVTDNQDSSVARFSESVESGHSSHGHSAQVAEILGITTEPVRLDSQAKYAVVARGEADIYMRLPTRKDYVEQIWDHAAGALVVSEAGGRVTDVDGKTLDFTHGCGLEINRGVLATSGTLHDTVLDALRQVGV